jgi:hypothetical protein
MFDWFRNFRSDSTGDMASDMEKINNDMNKVIPFPELKAAPPPMPAVESPAKIFYRLGLTDNNRVAFSMGYSEITLSKLGVEHMIQQLQVFRDQLSDEADDE